jgi:hypothetical protein
MLNILYYLALKMMGMKPIGQISSMIKQSGVRKLFWLNQKSRFISGPSGL